MTALETAVVALARSYLHVRELTNNSSPDIDAWLAFCGRTPGDSYCAAFASFCISHAAGGLVGRPPVFERSASALALLTKNPQLRVSAAEARALLGQGVPLVAVIDHGHGLGHALFAVGLDGDKLHSLEGNTGPGPAAPAQDRDGQGFYERHDRGFESINGGWLRVA